MSLVYGLPLVDRDCNAGCLAAPKKSVHNTGPHASMLCHEAVCSAGAEEHLGVSLAYGLPLVDGDSNAGRLWNFIHRFRMRVDLELPDMYNWFADCSLHVTLRAISS